MKATATLERPAQSRQAGASTARPAGGNISRALWTLYTLTLRQYLHGKRWILMGALFLLPVTIAIFNRFSARSMPALSREFWSIFEFVPQAILPLSALLYASGMIQDEQEEQTITYLLIRPIPKWALYLVKLLATLTTTVFLTALFTALTYAAVYLGSGAPAGTVLPRCIKAMGIHSLAVIAYCCLFGLISLFTRHVLVFGIVYAVIVEGLMANMPFGVRLLTVIYYCRTIAYRNLPFVLPNFGRTRDLAAETWNIDLIHDPNLLEHPQTTTCLAVLMIASLFFAIYAAVRCSRREFHVKTPEKG